MKKHSNLPDFSKLCAPEQNPIQDKISLLIHFFFLGSFSGFLWETLIFLVKDNTFRNRGFFYGPWLPVYLRYWDYSSYPYNFHGYICLFSAIGFGIAGMLWICVFSNIFRKYWFSLPPGFRRCFNSMLVLLFLTDCAAALIFPNAGHGITF